MSEQRPYLVTCPHCDGTGKEPHGMMRLCQICNGYGDITPDMRREYILDCLD